MGNPAFRLDIDKPRKRHLDRDRYVVWVLWLIGWSERSIGMAIGLRKGQVSGIINRSDYRGRDQMTDEERRAHLDDLKAIRFEDGAPIDGGMLNNIEWDLLPAGKRKRRRLP